MNFNDYQMQAAFSNKPAQELSRKQSSILDWTLGVCDEAGELAGVIKHHIFHHEPLNKMEVAKEVGDVLWYLSALCTELHLDMNACAELNIAKLRHRHGLKYSDKTSALRRSSELKFEDTEGYKQLQRRLCGE